MRFFLELSYNGESFHGWQRQLNASSVQQTVEDALSTILGKKIEITGAGRTDAGVHAREMFAHLDVEEDVNLDKVLKSANLMVGKNIALKRFIPVKDDAHARFDATSRTYRYYITMNKDPFNYPYSHRIGFVPDVELMNAGCSILMETSDFTSFAKLHADTKTNICRVTHAEWVLNEQNGTLTFSITADRFLRNMVRAVVGTLIDLGRGKIDINEFQKIIDKKNRCDAGSSMPAQALFLEKITYPPHIFLS